MVSQIRQLCDAARCLVSGVWDAAAPDAEIAAVSAQIARCYYSCPAGHYLPPHTICAKCPHNTFSVAVCKLLPDGLKLF